MSQTQYSAQCLIEIGNQLAPKEFMDDLTEVLVDTSLYLPGMFTILLRDPELKWADDPLLEIGKEVKIEMQQAAGLGSRKGTVIAGEIAALEPEFSADGKTVMRVRGYDKSHRLHRGKRTRTFLNQSDPEIARTIAGEAGLAAQVDPVQVKYDYVLQNNQTNMEFLLARAERIGYQVYVADGKLCFKRGQAMQGDGATLALGDALHSFRPCWAATHQADKVTVRGWDPKGKRAISSTATLNSSLNQGGMVKTGGDTAKGAFGAAEAVVADRPVSTVDEAKALATGLSNDISREFAEAEGICSGDPRVLAGQPVTIAGVGKRFSGKYWVTSATHVYNEDGYETTFSITGRQPNTVSHLLDAGKGHDDGRGLVQGVVTGLVTNLNDPDNLGRVKVKYAWLGEIESDWVRIAAPMAGAGRGFFYLPEVNDEVLVTFEHGDVHRPYIVGVLWNSQDKPPKPNSQVVGGGKVNQRILRSRSGHMIVLDDTDGQEQIVIQDKTAKNTIIVNSKENTITINVDRDLSSKAGGATTIQSTGKIVLKSSDDLSIECRNFSVKAQMNANVEANTNATLKGSVGVNVQNAAGAKVALSGPTVNLNNGALEVM
jgi:uncharacterized protein involved in type VI secretion and phage assembly